MIPTGCASLDRVLGGGLQSGLITDIFGPPGSGKSQICFSICAECASRGGHVLFIDTTGTFRPERVVEIACSDSVLRNVSVVRARTLADQENAINIIPEIDPTLIIVDSLTALFSSQISGPSRHLLLMRHLRELAYVAIKGRYHVAFTNMIRSQIQEMQYNADGKSDFGKGEKQQFREYLGSSVSLYSHVQLRLEIMEQERLVFRATSVTPKGGSARCRVVPAGIEDAT